MSKVMSLSQALQLIKDEDVVAVEGFVGAVTPEMLLWGLEEKFLEENKPENLTLITTNAQGNVRGGGVDHLAHKKLLRKVISAFFNVTPKIQRMILSEEIEGYMLPLGVISQLYRDIAGGRPGLVTHVGLETFADPRLEGGKMNSISKENYVELIELQNKEWLFYKSIPIDAALIRGTTADVDGNITMEREVATLQGPSLAQAVKRNKGKVIVQVERVATSGSLRAKDVIIPGILVDAVVISEPKHHKQTYKVDYNPALSGELKLNMEQVFRPPKMEPRKIVGRRALQEIIKEIDRGRIVTLGVGMPEFVGSVAEEEGVRDQLTLTVESGVIGGVPVYGLNFGASTNPDAIIDMPYQFDYYDGGGIDVTCVGMAQVDEQGNVNVSKLSTRIPGVGGFINVTQNTNIVIFCGTFTTGETDQEIKDGKLVIYKEGSIKKFVDSVEQVTFSARQAKARGQKVFYVTERAVFELTQDGIMLCEIAPGVDLETHILKNMEFKPIISKRLREMPVELFNEGIMGLKNSL